MQRSRGDLTAAAKTLDEAASRFARDLPPGHIGQASLAIQQALLAEARGDGTRALELADKAVDVADHSMAQRGQGAEYLEVDLANRARIDVDLKRFDQADADTSRVLELARTSQTDESITAGRAQLTRGLARLAEHKAELAHADFTRAAEVLAAAAGLNHSDTIRARQLAQR